MRIDGHCWYNSSGKRISNYTNSTPPLCSLLPYRLGSPRWKHRILTSFTILILCSGGERSGSVVECQTPEREVRGSRPTAAVLCPWARHFTPRKYWLITQEAMAQSRHDWKIVDWDVKPQHNQPTYAPVWTNWVDPRSDSSFRLPQKKEQSDQGLQCLPFCLHLLDTSLRLNDTVQIVG